MKRLPLVVFLASGVCAVWAQTNPVVLPRGIVNAFTQLPAPSTVGRGGIVQINGLNLGPPGGLKAPAGSLPTQLGDVQVLINGKPAPLYSVDIGTILAQVPVDATPGTADLVVERASGSSPAAHFTIAGMAPSIRTADGSGFGVPWGTVSGKSLLLSGMGLGPTTPAVDSGAPGSGATPTGAIDAFIGGIRTNATATASSTRVGEFDIQVDVPPGVQPGDLISLSVANRAANLTTFQSLSAPTMRAIAIPDGAPDFTSITDTDLNGNFLIATAAKDDSGCFPSYVFDVMKRTASPVADCLTTAARDPIVQTPGSNVLASLVGPPQAAPPAPISSTVKLFSPDLSDAMSVTLPSAVTTLAAAAGGNLCGVAPGPPAQTVLIDGQTGAATSQPCGAGGQGAGLAGAGAAGAIQNLNVDGLTVPLSAAVATGQGRSALLVADNANNPTKVEFAIVNQANGRPVLTKAIPDGWLPLLAPAAAAPPNAPPGAVVQRPRAVTFLDAGGPAFYALVNNGDNSKQAFVSFPLTQADPTVVPFPDGWYVAACVAAITPFDVQLSSSKVLAGSRDGTISIKQPCSADGFLQFNLDNQTITATALPSQAQMGVGGLAELNDYVYTVNPVVARASTDTVYTFDGATGSLITLRAPTSISGFTVPLQQISDLNWLVTEATNRVAGDAGLIVFDLDNQVVTPLPLPDNFASVSLQGIYVATRKVVALGQLVGGRGSQFVIYDLESGGGITRVPNPQGVAFVGPRPTANPGGGAGGGPGGGAGPGGAGAGGGAARGLISANTNANTISAIGLDAAGKQVGIVVVHVP